MPQPKDKKCLFFMADHHRFTKDLPQRGSLIGIDLGEKTTGLAISDKSRTVCSPLEQISHEKLSALIKNLVLLIKPHDVVGFVMGLPLNMDGTQGPQAHATIDKATHIAEALERPILLFDERLSTQAVEKSMLDADMTRKKRKERKDKLAATYFLQTALDMMQLHLQFSPSQ